MLTKEQLSTFATSWADKPREQVTEEIASLSMETKRIPDPYHFVVSQGGKLISPQTGLPIEEVIEKNTPLGQVEDQAFADIQNWAEQVEFGFSVWISPPFPERYEVSKVIVSEIEDGPDEKRLFNRAILLDIDGEGCIELANSLSAGSKYQTPEEVRRHPIFLNSKRFPWSALPETQKATELIITGQDVREKARALEWGYFIAQDLSRMKFIAQQAGIFGPGSTSCPPAQSLATAFDIFETHAIILQKESLESGICQKCKKSKNVGPCGICGECESCE